MRTILSGLTILLLFCSAASADQPAARDPDAPLILIQDGGSTITRSNDRRLRPQRYVCVVPPRQSDNRNRPYVCRAPAGRVGGTCRCENVVGTGRLDLDD